MAMQKNVLGQDIGECSCKPMTGWRRDGSCNTDEMDRGSHTVCCILTKEFLEFARMNGNDLITPMPQFNFPGLKPGDSWCVCASTWLEALNQGKACPVDLEATNITALEIIPLQLLEDRAV